MNINETYEFLDTLAMFGQKSGHEAFLKLLAKIDNPHQNLKIVHVAGTNGKGSTSAMISNILVKAGFKTGLFISPFVLEFRERIQLNGAMISEDDLCMCATIVKDNMAETRYGYFEVVTAIAFLYYKMKGCDVVVLEVGLGGRLDSTNVIAAPLVTVIMSIGLDHTAILGNTIEAIAAEKAGIIKGGVAVVYPLLDAAALAVIEKKCIATDTKLIVPNLHTLKIAEDNFYRKFVYKDMEFNKKLLGKFQIYNALCAIEVAIQLRGQGYYIDNQAIIEGIATTFFPARMEILNKNPLVILDGAHNQSGSAVLAEMISNLNCDNINIIIGTLRTKDYEEIMKTLLPRANMAIVVAPESKKAAEVDALAATAEKYCDDVQAFADYKEAVKFGMESTKKEDALIICGSLYLASDVRKLFKNN
ncbi:bifunctional folylpolyglutamate synthase/dihydrofolate synthase [Candidatus Epulonipiscium viviparus]|uniref:bifunctional folylpolyglutamate synthase/dihydrofolate synthase n=1 Tax=Candidatus Epulonipiscium viviparus TaxID=420336 RepID=UPI0027380F6D|nr:folylpolyglutamate synthase/dihydrofolate synthase family protein [Candidatus Epulopiscium viviparus]